jgi:hypothetical protein
VAEILIAMGQQLLQLAINVFFGLEIQLLAAVLNPTLTLKQMLLHDGRVVLFIGLPKRYSALRMIFLMAFR